MYLLTDRSRISIIAEYPLTFDGYKDAVLNASCLAQYQENHPSGITLEKRNADGTITEVITFVRSECVASWTVK